MPSKKKAVAKTHNKPAAPPAYPATEYSQQAQQQAQGGFDLEDRVESLEEFCRELVGKLARVGIHITLME